MGTCGLKAANPVLPCSVCVQAGCVCSVAIYLDYMACSLKGCQQRPLLYGVGRFNRSNGN